ncbi:MAG: SpoIIE family protein phosphatase [Vampirovibrionia bacterium]
MEENSINWQIKYENSSQQLEDIKLAYNNLLHDVLSFNELLSKKENTIEILTLVLRLARSIIDFNSGAIFRLESEEPQLTHSINITEEFQQEINKYIKEKKYENTIIKKRFDILNINEINSRIIMPLITKQQTVGIIDLIVPISKNSIKAEDIDLLWILCSIAAIEFESVQMSNRSEILSLMLSSLEKINSEDQLDNLLYLILNNLKQIVPASSYLLILRDKLLEISSNDKYCLPEIHSLDETCLQVDECIKTRNTIFIKRLSNCAKCKMCTESYLHEKYDGSLMLVPLYKNELGYGVISIFDKNISGNVFTEYNRHIVEIFAKQVTIAINNAILYDQQKKTNSNLATANEELSNHKSKLENALKELHLKSSILKKEIESAGIVQQAILSKADTPEYLDYHIDYKAHHSIGGDYFGITKINDHKTLIYIGDVSGKGVPAAIMTGFLKNEMSFVINKNKMLNHISPGKILSEVNSSSINVFKSTEQFTSVWCGIIDNEKKKITYASAGHDYPLLIKDDVSYIDNNNGPIMGLFETMTYTDAELDFTYPTKLILYTDGITDQESINGNRLNRIWLLETVKKYQHLSAKELCRSIMDEVNTMSKNIPQHDDRLLITLSLKDTNQ